MIRPTVSTVLSICPEAKSSFGYCTQAVLTVPDRAVAANHNIHSREFYSVFVSPPPPPHQLVGSVWSRSCATSQSMPVHTGSTDRLWKSWSIRRVKFSLRGANLSRKKGKEILGSPTDTQAVPTVPDREVAYNHNIGGSSTAVVFVAPASKSPVGFLWYRSCAKCRKGSIYRGYTKWIA